MSSLKSRVIKQQQKLPGHSTQIKNCDVYFLKSLKKIYYVVRGYNYTPSLAARDCSCGRRLGVDVWVVGCMCLGISVIHKPI